MLPADFRDLVLNLAEAHGFNAENLILGGDHLGPNRWQDEPAAEAMAKAEVLIETYVAAGFTKIHLDCSMPCADDPVSLTDEIVAERAARLAKIAEDTAVKNFGTARAFTYVVGTEVPVPVVKLKSYTKCNQRHQKRLVKLLKHTRTHLLLLA